MEMTDAEVIREGRNKLFELGWHQGKCQDATTKSVCMRGALVAALTGVDEDLYLKWLGLDTNRLFDTEEWLAKALQASGETGVVPCFNDQPDRTFDEVIAVFDKAEKLAEAAE